MPLDREKARSVATAIAQGDYDFVDDAVDALEECVQPTAYDISMRDLLTRLRIEQAKVIAITEIVDNADGMASGPWMELRLVLDGQPEDLTRQ